MGPTERERKYDRQLRLWAANGQESLERSHICLVGVSTAGTEALKNIILPGIGQVTVIDSQQVSKEDLSSNFFLDDKKSSISRAKSVLSRLSELNPSIQSRCIEEDINQVVTSRSPEFWHQFNVVIIGWMNEELAKSLSDILFELDIPLVVIDSIGFYGLVQVSLREHTIIETHPDSLVDLRLDAPWPELVDYCHNFDLSNISFEEHDHIPYVVLLLNYLQQWKSSHGGKLPSDFNERKQFKQILADSQPSIDSENYEEAQGAVWRLSQLSTVPDSIIAILNDPKSQNITEHSSMFWVLVSALRVFIEENPQKLLPLSGTLPDMKATTENYVQLQNIYRAKAATDFAKFKSIYSDTLKSLGKFPPEQYVTDHEGEAFCKNARFIKVIRGNRFGELENIAYDEENKLLDIYVAIRAVRRYTAQTKALPEPTNLQALHEYASTFLRSSSSAPEDILESLGNILQEIIRSNSIELVNISSLIGGIAAQEIIKLISHQYIPQHNTAIFDGIQSITQTFVI